jgi:hypothetical protein
MKTNQTAKVAAAQVLGQQAFVNGIKSAPCLDNAVMKMVTELSTPDFSNSHVIIAILKAWSKGWHEANLCADIQ